jgi:steroid delta-isomerase-like uncharacterized protein
MSTANKDVVRRLYDEVWNKRKVEVIKEIISPSHALHGPNASGTSVGPEAYERQYLLFLTGFPDLRLTIEDIVSEGNKVAVSWNFSGTHQGDFMGAPATNKTVSVDGITINHVANGKIMDSYISYDALGLMLQVGAVIAFGSSKSASAR